MKPNQITGLTAEIANRIGSKACRNSSWHTEGAALAVMSSLAACRYWVSRPVRPHDEPDKAIYEPRIVQRNFFLINQAPALADETCSCAEMVMRDAGDESVFRHGLSPKMAWSRSAKEPGFLLLIPYATLKELESLDPAENGNASHAAKVLNALQRSKHEQTAHYPHLVRKDDRSPDVLPPSPHTILAAIARKDLRDNLSAYRTGWVLGHCAVYVPPGNTTTNKHPEIRPIPTELARKMGVLIESRRDLTNPTLVNWSASAQANFGLFDIGLRLRDMDYPFLPDWVELGEQVIDIAALLAIGDNAHVPIISVGNVNAAIRIATRGYWSYVRLMARNSSGILKPSKAMQLLG